MKFESSLQGKTLQIIQPEPLRVIEIEVHFSLRLLSLLIVSYATWVYAEKLSSSLKTISKTYFIATINPY